MHEYTYGSSSFLLFSVLFFSGSLSCPPVSCTSFEQLLPAACSASVVLMMTVETNIENFHVINACVTGHILYFCIYMNSWHTFGVHLLDHFTPCSTRCTDFPLPIQGTLVTTDPQVLKMVPNEIT